MTYGVIFWGNMSDSNKIFLIQKKVIRKMAGAQERKLYVRLFMTSSIYYQ
jgi:hypothetical protein